MVQVYSLSKTNNGYIAGYKITYGLCIIGIPIGSRTFCDNFLMKMVKRAVDSSDALFVGLDNS